MVLEFWDQASWAERKWSPGNTRPDGLVLSLNDLATNLSHSGYWIPVAYQDGGVATSHRALAIRTTDTTSGSLVADRRLFNTDINIGTVLAQFAGGTASGFGTGVVFDAISNAFGALVDKAAKEFNFTSDLVKNLKLSALDTTLYNVLLANTGISYDVVHATQQGDQPYVDLSGTDVATRTRDFLSGLGIAQGNEGDVAIRSIGFDTSTYEMTVEFDVFNRQSWGTLGQALDAAERGRQGTRGAWQESVEQRPEPLPDRPAR